MASNVCERSVVRIFDGESSKLSTSDSDSVRNKNRNRNRKKRAAGSKKQKRIVKLIDYIKAESSRPGRELRAKWELIIFEFITNNII